MNTMKKFLSSVQGDLLLFGGALLLVAASFSPSDEPEAYLFPRLSSALMLMLTLVNLIRIFMNRQPHTQTAPLPLALLKTTAPALAAIIVFLTAAETLGFYIAATLLFAFIAWFYAPRRSLPQTALFTFLFIAALYLLFSVLLKVQLPALRLGF